MFQELVKSQGGLPKTCLNTSELLPCMKHEVLPCGTATLSGGFNPFEKVYAQSKVKNLSPKKSSLNTYVHILEKEGTKARIEIQGKEEIP